VKISFGMIVSIILIIAFISIAFYVIGKFLGLQKQIQTGQFLDDLQFDIDKIWKSSQGSQEKEYVLPSRIEKVCFVDFNFSEKGQYFDKYNELQKAYYGEENLIFYPVGSGEGLDSIVIEHINLEKLIEKNNPQCFVNTGGKIKLTMSMDFGDSLVIIE